jgi:hypothetical protein
MPVQLINRKGEFAPGGWLFVDPRTGMTFKDGTFESVVGQIQRHRLANPRIYPVTDGKWMDLDFIGNELEAFTCQRLGNDPHWCINGEVRMNKSVKNTGNTVKMPTPCAKCGNDMGIERLCPSCGGRRLVGYSCVQCGHLQSK